MAGLTLKRCATLHIQILHKQTTYIQVLCIFYETQTECSVATEVKGKLTGQVLDEPDTQPVLEKLLGRAVDQC